MKYIDSEKLIAEIERLRKTCASPISVCNDILSLIDELQQEQPEVDLKKERKNLNPTMLTYAAEVFGGKTLLEDISYSYRRELADYFRDLAKTAKEE